MRTFVALPLPQESLDTLKDIQSALRALDADIRWTAISSIHLTLKFLGEIETLLLPELAQKLGEACSGHKRFELVLGGLGVFPDRRSPRVVWCGVGGETESLANLQQEIESACTDLGFPPERRVFHPHLTLGRIKGKRNLQRILDYIRIGSNRESRFEARQVNIYRSTLTPRGALYDVLGEMKLSP